MFLNDAFPFEGENKKQNINHWKTLPKWIKQEFEVHETQKIIPEDEDFIARVLIDVLKYPDKKLSELHRLSHRLGKDDLKISKSKKGKKENYEKDHKSYENSRENIFTEGSIHEGEPFEHHHHQNEICDCCGFAKQSAEISICESFEEFPIVGLSTFLYFRTIINLLIMVALLFFIFGGFACYINYYIFVSSKGLGVLEGLSEISTNYNTIFSHKSIENNFTSNEETISLLTKISVGLIIVTTVLWSILVYVFKHQEVENAEMIDDESVTASDFSIMIQDAPIDLFKDFNYVSNQFDQYLKSILPVLEKEYFQIYVNENNFTSSSSYEELKKLKVTKVNIGMPFYLNENNLETDEEYEKLLQTFNEHKEKLIEWVVEFFDNKRLTVKIERREKRLQDYKDIEQKIFTKRESFLKKLQLQQKAFNNQNEMKTTVFLTFSTALCAKIVYELNETTILSSFNLFDCCKNDRIIKILTKSNKLADLKIERAPEPEDIVWENIGFPFWKIALRRLLTYLITGGILAGSFFLITFLESVQISSGSSVISMVISGSISILNVAIGQVIYFLTVFEKDITKTNYQASLALKTVFARLVNSIVIPVIVKQDNIYGKSGLVEDIFWLAITTSLLDPILKIFDFYYFFTRANYWHNSKPYHRIGMSQLELNKMAEKIEFEVGSQYIYVTNLFLITCFFTPLQPIIPIISIVGLIFMYWAQKYCLLNRMKRPIPGSDMINTALGQVITLGPIMFATGALVFSELLSNNGDGGLKFLLHLIAIGTGLLFYLLPFKTIYKWIFSEDEKFVNLNYFESRILLPSEYDRINPVTAKEGMKDFIDYMNKVDQICAHGHQNHHNETSNNKLLENLSKFVKKSIARNENPNIKNPAFMKVSNVSNLNKIWPEGKNVQKMNQIGNQKQKREFLRQKKKNSLDQGFNQNFDNGPYVNEFDKIERPVDLFKENALKSENSLLNFDKKESLRQSEFEALQDEILENWPTKNSKKIDIPKNRQKENNDNRKSYERPDITKNTVEEKQSERRTKKFNFMKMRSPKITNQEIKNGDKNTFSFSEIKSEENQYPFNTEPAKQSQRVRFKLKSGNSNMIQINPTNKDINEHEDNFQNERNLIERKRNSIFYRNEPEEFSDIKEQEDFKKRMSIPNEKQSRIKSKLFTPSTSKKTGSFEHDDEFDFY